MVGKDSKGGRISVIVVDDHEVVRVGLRALLAADANIDLLGEASSGREAVALTEDVDVSVLPLPNDLLKTKCEARDQQRPTPLQS